MPSKTMMIIHTQRNLLVVNVPFIQYLMQRGRRATHHHMWVPPTDTPHTVVVHLICPLVQVLSHSLHSYFWGLLRRFQHCTGHITTGSWKGRENKYIQLVKVLYCKLLTNGKQLPGLPLEAMPGTEPRPQSCEARVLPLCHCAPSPYSLLSTFFFRHAQNIWE